MCKCTMELGCYGGVVSLKRNEKKKFCKFCNLTQEAIWMSSDSTSGYYKSFSLMLLKAGCLLG